MLPIAQGSALGERRPRLIHSAFLRLRKNATRRKGVTHYALNATRGVAPHKTGCSYRARHFNQCNIGPPGRCPGLWATFGLTARPNHLPDVCANWFVFNKRLAAARHSPSELGLCARLAQTVVSGKLILEFSLPIRSAVSGGYFFAIRKKIFPKPLIFFTVCAGKVCYKVCNTCYKPCNAY